MKALERWVEREGRTRTDGDMDGLMMRAHTMISLLVWTRWLFFVPITVTVLVFGLRVSSRIGYNRVLFPHKDLSELLVPLEVFS